MTTATRDLTAADACFMCGGCVLYGDEPGWTFMDNGTGVPVPSCSEACAAAFYGDESERTIYTARLACAHALADRIAAYRCPTCDKRVTLLQFRVGTAGMTTGWYHEDDETILCGSTPWTGSPTEGQLTLAEKVYKPVVIAHEGHAQGSPGAWEWTGAHYAVEDPSKRMNGFVVPLVDKAGAEAIVAGNLVYNETLSPGTDTTAFAWDDDTLIVTHAGMGDEGGDDVHRLTPDEHGLYELGFGWTWQALDPTDVIVAGG